MKHVGANIKFLRIKNGWKQSHLAKKLNISIPAFSKIETGTTDMNLTRLLEIANIFSVTVFQILKNSNEVEIDFNAQELEKTRALLIEKEREISALQKKVIELFIELRG